MTKAAIRALDVAARNTTIYPKIHAAVLEGRAKRALGDQFGLTQFGVNLAVLAPGAWSSQRHWHEQEDEFIHVIEGEIVLIDEAGEHVLSPGMCAGFKAGVPNGHHLVNASDRPASYLEIGARSQSERAHYPDIDMKGVKSDGKWTLTRNDGSAF